MLLVLLKEEKLHAGSNLELGFAVYTRVIRTDLSPVSFLMSCSIPFVVFRASSTASVISNPFRAKSMAGWTSCFHGNRPCSFQASY